MTRVFNAPIITKSREELRIGCSLTARRSRQMRAIDTAGSMRSRERQNAMTRDRYRVKDDTGNPIPIATFLRRKKDRRGEQTVLKIELNRVAFCYARSYLDTFVLTILADYCKQFIIKRSVGAFKLLYASVGARVVFARSANAPRKCVRGSRITMIDRGRNDNNDVVAICCSNEVRKRWCWYSNSGKW